MEDKLKILSDLIKDCVNDEGYDPDIIAQGILDEGYQCQPQAKELLNGQKEKELKDCPFCGGEPEFFHWHTGECNVCCKLCHASTEQWSTKKSAINAWNRRQTQELVPLDEDNIYKYLRQDPDMGIIKCREIAILIASKFGQQRTDKGEA